MKTRLVSVVLLVALSVLALVGLPSLVRAQQPASLYIIEDLGLLDGDDNSIAWSINEAGDVVGWSNGSTVRAFIYRDGAGIRELSPLPGYDRCFAREINTLDQVAGTCGWEAGDASQPLRAVRWSGDVPQDLGTLGGDLSDAQSINDAGSVVGNSSTVSQTAHAFLYTDDLGMVDITPDTGQASRAIAYDINESGQIVGFDHQGAFRWTDGTREDLGVPEGFTFSSAYAINDEGVIAGGATTSSSSSSSSVRLARHVPGQGWEMLSGTGRPWAINNRGDIVGASRFGGGLERAFLYTDEGGLQDLSAMTNAPDEWFIQAAFDINEAGVIVGYASNRLTGASRAVRLTPATPADGNFTVNSTSDAPDTLPGDGACATDAGECTLRAAIQEANDLVGSDVITVPVGIYTLTLEGTREEDGATGDLDILRDSVTIVGGGTGTVIDGNGTERIFDIFETATVSISNVTLQNGFIEGLGLGDDGSAIRNFGLLTLEDSVIANNTITNGSAAIYNTDFAGGRTFTVRRVTVRDNVQSGFGFGAGITSGGFGHLRIEDSTFVNNTAHAYGGGLFSEDMSLVVTNSTFENNHVVGTPEPNSIDGSGGSIHVYASATIFNSEILSSTASAYGGGIFSRGVITLTHTLVQGNEAPYGGGFYNSDGFSILDTSVITDNVATRATPTDPDDRGTGGGGIESSGILTMTNTTISGNTTSGNGGGIASGGTLTVTNSTISGNGAAGDGGGIFTNQIYQPDLPFYGVSNLNNVTIADNTADTDGNGSGNGGGIANDDALIEMWNTIIGDNTDTGGEAPDCSGTFTSQGHNLIENPAGCTIEGDTDSNVTGQDPMLGPLEDNGGATPTHALLEESPAIDQGLTGCPNPFIDQRTVQRPQDSDGDGDAACDMGAFELRAPDETLAVSLGSFTATPVGNHLFGGLALLALAGGLLLVVGRRTLAARA
ncbi:MAG TPA: choice-of-anchor Q domain-containing protein [Ardenticatenaceae bacterium]